MLQIIDLSEVMIAGYGFSPSIGDLNEIFEKGGGATLKSMILRKDNRIS